MKGVVFCLVAILFLLSVSSITGLIHVVKADSGIITINADGSITPSTAPIYSADNITYTLTGNITAATNGILIQRNNVVLNGAGYTLTGSGSGSGVNAGINVTRQSNVTIGNMTIENFGFSIDLEYSSNCTLSGNTVATSSRMGSIILDFSNNDVLSGNTVTANPNDGIVLASCSNDTLSGNDFTNNGWSIYSDYSSNNTLSGNNFVNNTIGMDFDSSSNNTIYNNNFINNTYAQVYSSDSTNVWDNGSVGNYWSDYLTKYPNATETDGVWNTPYVIDANNTDYYPLAFPIAVVPEFPSFLILPLFLIATLLAVIVYRKKGEKTSQS
jgi:parallel beta-helix repeat protein